MSILKGDASTESYIVASIGTWNKGNFDSFVSHMPGKWHFVDTPDLLCATLRLLENPRYIFFIHWNWLVPRSIWERFECVCFHMTDVPYGRGGSPLQNLIIRGHKETKLTALRMTGEMDAGPVYIKHVLSLKGTAHEIYCRASELSYSVIKWMVDQKPNPVMQEGQPVIFHRRKPNQSSIPRDATFPNLYDHIRMLDAPGYPHAFIEYGDFILEFTNASLDDDELTANVRFQKRIEN